MRRRYHLKSSQEQIDQEIKEEKEAIDACENHEIADITAEVKQPTEEIHGIRTPEQQELRDTILTDSQIAILEKNHKPFLGTSGDLYRLYLEVDVYDSDDPKICFWYDVDEQRFRSRYMKDSRFLKEIKNILEKLDKDHDLIDRKHKSQLTKESEDKRKLSCIKLAINKWHGDDLCESFMRRLPSAIALRQLERLWASGVVFLKDEGKTSLVYFGYSWLKEQFKIEAKKIINDPRSSDVIEQVLKEQKEE